MFCVFISTYSPSIGFPLSFRIHGCDPIKKTYDLSRLPLINLPYFYFVLYIFFISRSTRHSYSHLTRNVSVPYHIPNSESHHPRQCLYSPYVTQVTSVVFILFFYPLLNFSHIVVAIVDGGNGDMQQYTVYMVLVLFTTLFQ